MVGLSRDPALSHIFCALERLCVWTPGLRQESVHGSAASVSRGRQKGLAVYETAEWATNWDAVSIKRSTVKMSYTHSFILHSAAFIIHTTQSSVMNLKSTRSGSSKLQTTTLTIVFL